MILFEEDWLDYPGAVIHYETRNKSAIDLAAKLRMMGVRNCAFFLALIDTRLKDVDPHDPNLTFEQMAMVGVECKINPWYFLREVARAPSISGTGTSPITFNRAIIALWWCFFNHIYIILIQPRQTGKSFGTDLLMTLLMNFLCNNTQINLMTKDDKLRAENIARLKNIYEELPKYLHLKTRADANNTEELSIKALGNTYKTHVPNASPKRAYNLGRGMTTPIFQVDEGPFQPNIGIAMPAALLAMTAAEEQAKKNNEPYGVILTTTAGKIDDRDGAYVYGIVQSSALWSERYYDAKNQAELEVMVRANGRGLYRIYAAFSYKQLGKDDQWMRNQLERAGATGDDANRDLFNRWTSGNSFGVLPTNILETMRASVVDPLYEQIYPIGSYIIRWYLEEDELEYFLKDRKVIVGMDTSDAQGGDDIAMVLVDVETGATIGAGNFNETNLIRFSRWIVYLIQYYPDFIFIIERRSSGIAIIDYILLQLAELGIDPSKRLFNWIVNDPHNHKERYAEFSLPMSRRPEDLYDRSKKHFGFATSGGGQTSRSELYSATLHEAAKVAGNRMMDATLVDQVSGLINKNGRIDHAPGGHDDSCFIGSTLVRTIDGNRPIKDLKVGDLVLTRQGYKPIVKLFCTEKEVIRKFGLVGTPDHPFITPDGEIEFKDLTLFSRIYVWNEKQSITMEKTIIDILKPKGLSIETIFIGTIKITNRLWRYIAKSGRTIMGPFQKATTSITKMKTRSTIASTTSNASLARNTEPDTQLLKKPERNSPKTQEQETLLASGVKKTQSWLQRLAKRTGLRAPLYETGKNRTQNWLDKFTRKPAGKASKPEKETVYNLMVADCHEYYVNDILVHNCISWLLCHWFLSKALNLSHYGIDRRKILSDRGDKSVEKSDTEKTRDYLQSLVRNRIDQLFELMQSEPNEAVVDRYKNELRALDSQLVLEEGEVFSIDAFLEEIREKRSYLFTRAKGYLQPSDGYNYENVSKMVYQNPNTVVIR